MTEQTLRNREYGQSPFPLVPRWESPDRNWHDCYPEGVPPRLDYPRIRSERLLLNAARRFPARTVQQYFRSCWTYHELVERVRHVAGVFLRLGLQPGDRALVVLPNCPDFLVAWFALHWIGVEVVPVNPLLTAKDLKLLVDKTQARAVFGLDVKLGPVVELVRARCVPLMFVASLAPHLPWYLRVPYRLAARKAWPAAVPQSTLAFELDALYRTPAQSVDAPLMEDAGTTAVLQPTGGTTGTPKVAVLSHANLLANVAQIHAWSGGQPGAEVVLAVLPFFHAFGASVCLSSAIAGGSTILLHPRFSPSRVCRSLERDRPTFGALVPFMVREICQELKQRPRDVRGSGFWFSGGAALASDVREEFEALTGARIFEGYGLSEASPVTHANPPDETARPGSIGLPLPGTDARVVDLETGTRELVPGEVGELVVRGPQVMSGYLHDETDSKRTVRDGWLYTGDMATVDGDGFFQIVDRKKDMIITGGLNVFPAEVEDWLRQHPGVAECSVVGRPDERYGETVVACVVPHRGACINPLEIQQFCRSGLAGYKVPRIIEVRDHLPTNFLGKVRRNELRGDAA